MPVKTNLQSLREKHGDQRMDLVRDLEVSYQVVQKWENDILYQLDTNILHRLMERYDATYEQLVRVATPEEVEEFEREKAAKEAAKKKKEKKKR